MLDDFCYSHFGALGKVLFRSLKGIEDTMDSANMKIHPEVYMSKIGFFFLLSFIVPIVYMILMFPLRLSIFILPLFLSVPLIVLVFGAILPKAMASNRISGLKNEIPYASMYLSVMTSGGISPYTSLLRLRKTTLFPNLRNEIERIQRIVISHGMDPVSAMAKAAKVVGLREYKELLLGYASTMRTGGDTLHYLYSQTESMFRRMASRIKTMGEHMSLIMEGYTIFAILGVLGIYLIFIVSLSFPQFQAFSPSTFFLFSFIIMPIVAVVFLYLADTFQINFSFTFWKTYKILLITIPLCIFFVWQMVLPYYITGLPLVPGMIDLLVILRDTLHFKEGCEAALGLAISLIVLSVPVYIFDSQLAEHDRGILEGVTNFLRDLVENRKSGLSPEKSIQLLSERDYGRFTKHLKLMSTKISWGISLRKIFDDFKSKVKNWLSLVNLYLLTDTIEVGGGTEESLETLAEFAESTRQLEVERNAQLSPLFIVPYMGIALITITTIMLLQLFTSMSLIGGTLIQTKELMKMLITPLVLHAFTLGLVTGKIISGRISRGFKHAIILIFICIFAIWFAFNT